MGVIRLRYKSKIGEVLEDISNEIVSSDVFKNTPIFYDFLEVDPNVLPPSCIIYKPLEWNTDSTNCNYECQLDIVLIITSEERREGVVGQLFMFREALKELIDDYSMRKPYLTFIEGSAVRGWSYNKEAQDSYKETKQLFSSMAVLSYQLRY